MMLNFKYLITLILLLNTSSDAIGQSTVLDVLRNDFKALSFDSSFVETEYSFDSDVAELPAVSPALIDALLGTHTDQLEFSEAMQFRAVGSFQFSEENYGYLIHSWSENERENQTFLIVVQKTKESYTVTNAFLVGVQMGSECCENSTTFRFHDQNSDGHLDLQVYSVSKESSGEESKVRNESTVYLWTENTFKKFNITSEETYEYGK